MKKKILKSLIFITLFVFSFNALITHASDWNIVLRALIKRVLKEIEKELESYTIINSTWIQTVNYDWIYLLTKKIIKNEEKLKFDSYLTKKLIIWIHHRENNNNIKHNPLNWDWIFQLDRMKLKIKWNPDVYCTTYDKYKRIYLDCNINNKCDDFTINLAYQYCDYIQYMKHKFWRMNIQREAIYWRLRWWRKIQWLYDFLKERDIVIDKELLDLFLKSFKKTWRKTMDFTKENFKFIKNSYWIKDFNDFIKYLQKNYLISYDEDFIKVMFEAFQDAVVFTYYNWLWANHWSRIKKSYVINIPASFAMSLWTKPFVKEKPSWRWYNVKDAQIWALIWYFYVDKPDKLKYLLLFIDMFLR